MQSTYTRDGELFSVSAHGAYLIKAGKVVAHVKTELPDEAIAGMIVSLLVAGWTPDRPGIVRLDPSGVGRAVMPHSEVMMHLGIAGKSRAFLLLRGSDDGDCAVQVLDDGTGEPFSSPVTPGEAGIRFDAAGPYYIDLDRV